MAQVVAQNKAELEQEGWEFQSEEQPDGASGAYAYSLRLATNLQNKDISPSLDSYYKIPVLVHIEGDISQLADPQIRICNRGRGTRRPLLNPNDRLEGRKTIKVSGSWRIMSSGGTKYKDTYLDTTAKDLEIFYEGSEYLSESNQWIFRMYPIPVAGRAGVFSMQSDILLGIDQYKTIDVTWSDIMCGYCKIWVDSDGATHVRMKHGSFKKDLASNEGGIWTINRCTLKDVGLVLFDGEKQVSGILPIELNATAIDSYRSVRVTAK